MLILIYYILYIIFISLNQISLIFIYANIHILYIYYIYYILYIYCIYYILYIYCIYYILYIYYIYYIFVRTTEKTLGAKERRNRPEARLKPIATWMSFGSRIQRRLAPQTGPNYMHCPHSPASFTRINQLRRRMRMRKWRV